ncbi:MAG: urate hydroxylase PuuD [Comamonadaceae bacterium]
MSQILQSLNKTLLAGLILLIAIVLIVGSVSGSPIQFTPVWTSFLFRWLHVACGIMWIGLLYYFNFVQIPSMPKIPDEQKPAIGKVIAPAALFWFRWAALATVVTGLVVAALQGYLHAAFTLQPGFVAIGIGMWIALVMAFNVWFIIWPNQKKALGIVVVEPEAKARAARLAMLTSRTNTLLSIPMLYMMVAQSHGGL